MQNESYILERLGMTVDDVERIEERCEDKGITVRRLLRQFLCDLIDNDHSAGTDERLAVDQWFDCSTFKL